MIEWFLVKFFGYRHRFYIVTEYRIGGMLALEMKGIISFYDKSNVSDEAVMEAVAMKAFEESGSTLKNGELSIGGISYLGCWR